MEKKLNEATSYYDKIIEENENEVDLFCRNNKESSKNNFFNSLNSIVLDMNTTQLKSINLNIENSHNNANSEEDKQQNLQASIKNEYNDNNNLKTIEENKSELNLDKQIEQKEKAESDSNLSDNINNNNSKEMNDNDNKISEGSISSKYNTNNNKFLENINLDNSFERLEKTKLDEIDDLFSPFGTKNSNNKNFNFSQYGFNLNLNQTQGTSQDRKVSVFKFQDKDSSSNNVKKFYMIFFIILEKI